MFSSTWMLWWVGEPEGPPSTQGSDMAQVGDKDGERGVNYIIPRILRTTTEAAMRPNDPVTHEAVP